MKTKLNGAELRRFFRRVEIMELERADRKAPADDVEKVAQRAADYILAEFRSESTPLHVLANTAQNLSVLESMGDDAPQELVNSVARDTGQRARGRVEYSMGGRIWARG